MNIYKEKAQIKAIQYGQQIEDLCTKFGLEISADDAGNLELMTSVKDDNGKEWWAFVPLNTN